MKLTTILQIFCCVCCIMETQVMSSLFEIPNKSSEGPWDEEDYSRIINENKCECGVDDSAPGADKPWQMFVLTDLQNELLCTGTIITSNLLATSHACLQLSRRRYNVYDAWFPKSAKGRNMYHYTSYVISRQSNDARGSPFRVVGVFFNYRHGVNLATHSDPAKDMVLFQVEPHFTSIPQMKLKPICLPTLSDLLSNVVTHTAYYIGPTESPKAPQGRSWSFQKDCEGILPTTSSTTTTTSTTTTSSSTSSSTTTAAPTTTSTTTDRSLSSGELATSTNPPDQLIHEIPPKQNLSSIPGQIVVIDLCDKRADDFDSTAEQDFICFKKDGPGIPKFGDGALYIRSEGHAKRYFLVGIGASKARSSKNTPRLAQFTNVSSLIKYIEYHASQANSSWCNSDKLTLPTQKARLTTLPRKNVHVTTDDDDPQCVCGLDMFESESDRPLVGKARNDEFPWAVIITTDSNDASCTGFLLNDRMVLTSESCVRKVELQKNLDKVLVVTRETGQNFVEYKIKNFAIHEEYKEGESSNNLHQIAVIVLQEKVRFGNCENVTMRPICLPPRETTWRVPRDANKRTAMVAGWGKEYLAYGDLGSPVSMALGSKNQWVAVGVAGMDIAKVKTGFIFYANVHYHLDFIYAKADEYQAKWCQSVIY